MTNSSLSTCNIRVTHDKTLIKYENEINLVSLQELLDFAYGYGANDKVPKVSNINHPSLYAVINHIESKINLNLFTVRI